jgi:DNA-binding GntR family transcriptional regulator
VTVTRSLREQIADDVRSDVLCARIHPGARLSEMELAKRFGTSRGPIREALSQLVSEGLLIAKRNCGVTVAPPPPNGVRDLIIPIRRTVESYALRSYFDELTAHDFRVWEDIIQKMHQASRADQVPELVALDLEFHRALISRTGQPELLALWQSVVAQVRGHFGEKVLLRYRDQLDAVVQHHRKLIAVFRKGNCKAAVAELKKHIS